MQIYEGKISYTAVGEIELNYCQTPAQVYQFMKDAFAPYPVQETAWVILLNRKYKALGRVMISMGTLTSTLLGVREVFRAAILGNAVAIVVCHNHPSGDSAPSSADIEVTRQLRAAGEVMDIQLLDHVIVGCPTADPAGIGFYSFRQAGLLA